MLDILAHKRFDLLFIGLFAAKGKHNFIDEFAVAVNMQRPFLQQDAVFDLKSISFVFDGAQLSFTFLSFIVSCASIRYV